MLVQPLALAVQTVLVQAIALAVQTVLVVLFILYVIRSFDPALAEPGQSCWVLFFGLPGVVPSPVLLFPCLCCKGDVRFTEVFGLDKSCLVYWVLRLQLAAKVSWAVLA